MSTGDQQLIKQQSYSEAMRYMDNAKETLTKAGKDNQRYKDPKYVRTACGTAYNGLLIALDAYLFLKGIQRMKGRKSIEYYREQVGKFDKKMLQHLNDAYDSLHLSGYYDGTLNVCVVKAGFDKAYGIIDKIKPDQP